MTPDRAALLAEGRRKAAILRAIDLDGPVCECGQWADERHPPLARPGPLLARVQPLASRPPSRRAFGIER